jgi:mycothiol synthase
MIHQHQPAEFKIVLRPSLAQPQELRQVQLFLQHVVDHDGNLPIGEHIFLKLKSQAEGDFAKHLAQAQETALALVAYASKAEANEEDFPGYEINSGEFVVGYLQFLAQPAHNPPRLMVEIAIHPHHRREGIAKSLLKAAINIAQQGKFKRLDLWAYHSSPDSSAQHFADFTRMVASRKLLHLRRPLETPLPSYSLPDGYKLRAFRPGEDDVNWLELNHLIFAQHPENGSWSLEDLRLRFIQNWFNPQDFLLLENAQATLVGFHWTKLHTGHNSMLYPAPPYLGQPARNLTPPIRSLAPERILGEVYIVGVHPALHGLGLGRSLTLAGLQHLKERGATIFGLYVDGENLPAQKLYYELGFQLHHTDISYSLDLSESPY